ncbi:VP1 [Gyrovirus GyV8]|uniref:Capsid protein n=1 Tax=Gyrovirus GyV8 TaxID=1670973 RepID=A0A0G4ANJ1_9VIRU|nr:VP1 [Gyrovirus GyV8]AKM76222.1 VP1 [Gyrovirus GyV8]
MARRPRGRYYHFRRGRWHRHRRHPRHRRGYGRRFRRRHYRGKHKRRSFNRYVKRLFFNPKPGFYTVRLPNPYNRQNIFFQGLILVPLGVDNLSAVSYKSEFCRVASITLSLRNLLLAVFPLDAISKAGGPIPDIITAYHTATEHQSQNLPPWTNMPQKGNASATPFDWWRWSLIMMRPEDNVRRAQFPYFPERVEDLLQILGGWHLFRHIKTTMVVMATRGMSGFDPVASLFVQDSYWLSRTGNPSIINENGNVKLQAPMPGGGVKGRIETSTITGPPCDEYMFPSFPPQWSDKTQPTQSFKQDNAFYCLACYPSFLTLSALGAPWAFPPTEKSVSRSSFNHHSVTGNNDPQGRRWMTFLPKPTALQVPNPTGHGETPTSSPGPTGPPPTPTEIDTPIGVLFLAQTSWGDFINHTWGTKPYNFGTTSDESPNFPPFSRDTQNRPWAVIKLKSKWQLGNKQRPYWYDTNWWKQSRTQFG